MKISGFTDEICDSFEGQLQAAQSLGMEYISLRSADGVNVGALTMPTIVQKIKPLLEAYGIGVSSIGSPLGKVALGDEAAFDEQLAMAVRLRDIALALGCRYIRLFSFYPPEGTEAAAWSQEVERRLGQLLAVFAGSGVTPLLENEKELYGDTPDRCEALLRAFAGQGLGLIFDPANFVQVGVDPLEAFHRLKPWIRYVHIKDADRESGINVLCGTGGGCLPELLQELRAEGYDGFLTLEPHLVEFSALSQLEQNGGQYLNTGETMSPLTAFARQLEAVKQLWKQGKQEVRS